MKFFSSILVVLLVAATSMWSSVDAQACVASCTNCKDKSNCKDDGTGTLVATVDGACGDAEACIVVSGNAVCKPAAETKCDCGGNAKGCDPFNPLQSIICFMGQVFLDTECPPGEECTGAGQCAVPDPASASTSPSDECALAGATEVGFKLLNKSGKCNAGVLCKDQSPVGSPVNCADTEIFNVMTGKCAPFPVENSCGCGKKNCPVITDCKKYVVCNGDTLVDEEECTDLAMMGFDATTGQCAATALGDCLQYENCQFPEASTNPSSSVTTTPSIPPNPSVNSSSTPSPVSPTTTPTTTPTTPPTTTSKPSDCNAANVNKRYPHETDCRKYYTCRLVSRSTYQYVVSKCPGTLAYNASNNYCDLPEKVNPPCTQ